MFAPLVLAAALTPPPPPGPLSPADLPPPSNAKPVEPPVSAEARACEVKFRSGRMPHPLKDATGHAVAAIASADRAQFAEADGERAAWGYTDTCRIAVVLLPESTGTTAYVFAASHLPGAAQPAVEAVHRRLTDPVADAPHRVRYGRRDTARETRLPPFGWYAETRPANKYRKYFAAQTALAFERQGYEPAGLDEANPAAVALGRRGADRHKVFILTTDGPPDGPSHFVAVGLGRDAAVARADAEAVCRFVVRSFYD